MIQRLDIDPALEGEPAGEKADPTLEASDRIRAWLDVLVRLLPAPDAERRSIRDELEEHLHERVRDLLMGGRDEDEAVRTAIEELGEAADLARRYRHASRTAKRRWIMNLTALGIGASVVVAGAITLAPERATLRPSVFQDAAPKHEATLTDARLDVDADMPMQAFVTALVDEAGLGVSVDWEAMEDIGLGREEPLGVGGRDVAVADVFASFTDRTDGCFGWRFDGEIIRLNDAEHFDLTERKLVVYDVAAVVDVVSMHDSVSHEVATEEVGDVITSFVEPESWEDMGGRLAHYRFIGGKLFVNAPPRMHRQLEWILLQLLDGDPDGAIEKSRSTVDSTGAR